MNTSSKETRSEPPPKRATLIARFLVRETLGVTLIAGVLVGTAGDPGWWPAWAVAGLTLAWVAATARIVIWVHPGLLAERLGPRKGARRWDTVLMAIYGLLQLAVLIVAALDHRGS